MRAEVLHTAAINGHGVRYCRPPGVDPDIPWTVFHDLAKAVGANRTERRRLQDITARSWGDRAKTVRIGVGRELIVASEVAKAFMFGLYERGMFGQTVLDECGFGEGAASDILFERLGLSLDDRLDWSFRAHFGEAPKFEVKDGMVNMDRADLERLTGLSGAALDRSFVGLPNSNRPRLATSREA